MAGQRDRTASAFPEAALVARLVGNAFVNEYYKVFFQSPRAAHRFYTSENQCTRTEAGADGDVETVVSQFHRKVPVMATDYSDFEAEIFTVDCQDSPVGGVFVMVTGSLSSQDSGKRHFVQSFLLALQEKIYVVVNDVFRYLDGKPAPTKQAHVLANGFLDSPQATASPEPVPDLPVGHELSEVAVSVEPTVEEVSNSEHVDLLEADLLEADLLEAEAEAEDDGRSESLNQKEISPVLDEQSSPTPVAAVTVSEAEAEDDRRIESLNQKGTPPVLDEQSFPTLAAAVTLSEAEVEDDERKQSSPTPLAAVTASLTEEATEDTSKKSYASSVSFTSIVRTNSEQSVGSSRSVPSMAPAVSPKASSVPTMERLPNSSSRQHSSFVRSHPQSRVEKVLARLDLEDRRSVYVKGLPMNITSSQVIEEFAKFGAVKDGGVTIKRQERVCFAFVDFKQNTSADIAIRASPMTIDGSKVSISEKKRPTGFRTGGGGRLARK